MCQFLEVVFQLFFIQYLYLATLQDSEHFQVSVQKENLLKAAVVSGSFPIENGADKTEVQI
jgi:hypothetical protein